MESYQQQVQRILKGQQAPLIDGERHILAHCRLCDRIWLMQGSLAHLSLSQEEIARWATRLGANIDDLPAMTCRTCADLSIGGEFALDEYADQTGRICGYGYSWEALDPPAHMLVGVFLRSWLQTVRPQERYYNVVTDPPLARAVLSWLHSSTRRSLLYQPFPPEAIAGLSSTNPPCAHAPGTGEWVWRGAAWTGWCEPLGGGVRVTFAQAGNATDPFVLPAALAEWRGVALRARQYAIAGET